MPCMFPKKTLEQEQYLFDICEDSVEHWLHNLGSVNGTADPSADARHLQELGLAIALAWRV